MRIHSFGAILISLAVPALTAQEILWDRSEPGVLRRALLVPKTSFLPDSLDAIARSILKDNPDRVLIDVRIVTDPPQANLFPRPGHLEKKDLVRFHALLSDVKWQFAHLLVVDEKAVLRIRDGETIVTRPIKTTSGDVARMAGGQRFDLLFVAYGDYVLASRISVFALANGSLSRSACVELYRQLKRALPERFGHVEVRTDPWFMNEEFPIYFWFHQGSPPLEMNESPMVICSEADSTVRCRTYGKVAP